MHLFEYKARVRENDEESSTLFEYKARVRENDEESSKLFQYKARVRENDEESSKLPKIGCVNLLKVIYLFNIPLVIN